MKIYINEDETEYLFDEESNFFCYFIIFAKKISELNTCKILNYEDVNGYWTCR